jgi:hypothetical protein
VLTVLLLPLLPVVPVPLPEVPVLWLYVRPAPHPNDLGNLQMPAATKWGVIYTFAFV